MVWLKVLFRYVFWPREAPPRFGSWEVFSKSIKLSEGAANIGKDVGWNV